jgi:hypothetical protein
MRGRGERMRMSAALGGIDTAVAHFGGVGERPFRLGTRRGSIRQPAGGKGDV